MIEDRDADERADLAQPAREIEIFLARRGIARRMVVHDDRGRGGHSHERPKHLARMDLDAAHAAARDLDDLEQGVAHVDADHEEHLLREAREARRDVMEDVVGAAEVVAMLDVLDGAAPELERGGDARGALRTDAGDLRELARRGARQDTEATRRAQEVRGDGEHRMAADSGTEEHREQLLVGAGRAATPPESFTRSLGEDVAVHARRRSKARAGQRE